MSSLAWEGSESFYKGENDMLFIYTDGVVLHEHKDETGQWGLTNRFTIADIERKEFVRFLGQMGFTKNS